jgi:hypothetical protein
VNEIGVAVWGAVTALLAVAAIVSTVRVKRAEQLRDEAVQLAAHAMNAKQSAEDGFVKAKAWFDEQSKRPITALMTDDQCENVAKYVAGRVTGVTRSATETEQ